ncbi:MAG: hypothetical protein NZ529_02225 [Cytophagaceae bacterium]|nr:hypothetical protein [Cytophagaceae bacterium]MDW8455585.1 hypothetical protein [Cytophagaceae bacterium]
MEKDEQWERVVYAFIKMTGKKPTLSSMLFLIGMRELGSAKKKFTKEQKQDLMHIAVCKLLSYAGFYALEGLDSEGWPIWKMLKPVPHISLQEQEHLLKSLIIEYFEKEGIHT